MELAHLLVNCKSWGCSSEISLDEIPGFYFYGHELRYDASSFRVTCQECGKTHKYKMCDVIVHRLAEAVC